MRRAGRSALVVTRTQWPMMIWLTVVWVALWGNLSAANVLAGLGVALLLKLLLPLPPLPRSGRVDPRALAVLLARFVRDLLLASAQIAWQALRPGHAPGVAVVAVQLRTDSEALMTLIAEMVSLVPGSIVLDLDPQQRSMHLHVLGVEDLDGVEEVRERTRALEDRVLAAFAADVLEEEPA